MPQYFINGWMIWCNSSFNSISAILGRLEEHVNDLDDEDDDKIFFRLEKIINLPGMELITTIISGAHY